MPNNDISADTQVARIFEWRRGFNALHLMDIGVRLQLFRTLAQAPEGMTADALALKLGLKPHFVQVWCNTAYGFELLEGATDNRFKLAPFIDKVLASPGHPRYLGGYVRLGTQFATEDFRQCTEAFRTGEFVPFQGRSDEFLRTIGDSTAGLHVLSARKILPELPGVAERLNGGGRLLEVGCGVGGHLLQVAKAFPASQCAGVDIDRGSIAAARAAITQAGLADRVQLHEGDVGAVIQPESFDVVVMVEVLHEIAQAIRPQVIAGCYRALKPGGWIVIIDETYPSTLQEMRAPEFMFPLQTGFEELLWGNIIPTREEQETLLRSAGFAGEINRSIVGEGFTVLTSQRS